MKKIVTAMGNDTLNNELKKFSNYNLNDEDLYYQEAVIDMLSEEKSDVLVVSSLLQGQFEFGEFVEKIRKFDKNIRIIVIADEMNDFLRRKLNDKDVTDIFLDDSVSVSDIIDAINREESLLMKYSKKKEIDEERARIEKIMAGNIKTEKVSEEKSQYEEHNENKNIQHIVVNEITQKQEVITISGTNGSGKSTFLTNFSKVLRQNTKAKILLIDLDTLSGNLDELLDIHKVPQNVEVLIDDDKKCGLNYAAELISRNRFDTNVFDELVINMDGIDVLTGNTSLHYCQNVLMEKYYDKILECAKEKYDFVLIDTSSNIFLDSTKWALVHSNRVFFVTENNFISMKKASQLLSVFTENWKIWKSKIEIIINKYRDNGIEADVVEKVLEGYKVIGTIRSCEEENEQHYINILESINYIPKKSLITKILSIKTFDGFLARNNRDVKVRGKEIIRDAN